MDNQQVSNRNKLVDFYYSTIRNIAFHQPYTLVLYSYFRFINFSYSAKLNKIHDDLTSLLIDNLVNNTKPSHIQYKFLRSLFHTIYTEVLHSSYCLDSSTSAQAFVG